MINNDEMSSESHDSLTHSSLGGALRDIPKNGCEGDYIHGTAHRFPFQSNFGVDPEHNEDLFSVTYTVS